jgi:4,5:9,10-diseco-3-hydroxy-5,9,17-trioxoandrosta-1(10),2-diene-4-oate hydrolase
MSSISATPAPAPSEPYGPTGRAPWLDVDWRKHQRWVTVEDRPVNVIDLGEGPPIVFIHGLGGSWQNWLEQLPVFADSHRVVALDLPGFGHSPMPREKISISLYARVLDGVMDALGIDAAAIVGNSMGGFTAAELAIAFPQRVERMVLVSPAGISTYANPLATRAAKVVRRLRPLLATQTAWVAAHADTISRRPALRDATLRTVALYPSRLPPTLVAELLRGAGKPGFVDALEANLNYDFRHRLPEIVCPTLVVWGERDELITVRDADVYTELIPGARKLLFPDTGHTAMLERPAKFNGVLEEFLAE